MHLGFVRIVSNPAFSRKSLYPPAPVTLLGQNLSHSGHELWKESLQLPAAVRGMEERLQGYRRLTDMYLLAFASRRKGVLARFDSALEVVPTR